MKITNKIELLNDTKELALLEIEFNKLEAILKKIIDRRREIIYKYDTAKMDYSRIPNR
jgi:hypothetical protein